MTANDYASIAEEFAKATSCYMLGAWGQKLTQGVYDYLCNKYPKNRTYGNQVYVGTSAFPFDCICFVKACADGATVNNRIEFNDIKNSPMGDIDNAEFLALMKKNNGVSPKFAKRGMGLASRGHAGIALGNGLWVDANKCAGQNGVKIHSTGIDVFDVAGEIPGIDYSAETPQVGDTIPMVITKIENGIAYGQAEIGPAPGPSPTPTPEIVVGSKVTIKPGAVSGGGNPDYAGKPILPQYANGKYVDTVVEIATFNGEKQARLGGINTWVAIASLNLVE